MFKTTVNPKETNSSMMILKVLCQLELIDLYKYLTDDKNKSAILLNLNNGFAVSIETKEWMITMFNRSEYFVLVGFVKNEHNKRIVNYGKKI